MLEEVECWLARRSWSAADRPLDRLLAARAAAGEAGRGSVSVVLPALNEEATVGEIVATIRRELMDKVRLVDELVVIDSGSTDATAKVAREAAPGWCTATRYSPGYRPCPARARCCGGRSWSPVATSCASSTPT